jgi:chitin synthase
MSLSIQALESCCGYISVLPGAFSAYRYCAVRVDENGEGPLAEYFKSINMPMAELGPFQGNMYLAEDRILCFELIVRKDCAWTLHYVKDAVASTDVPEKLVDLIKQRRRWLNGSFFAMLYSIINFGRLWSDSTHGFLQKIIISLQFAYFCFQVSVFLLPGDSTLPLVPLTTSTAPFSSVDYQHRFL